MHLEKYKTTQVSGLIRHDLRESENHSNENIDKSRSHLNYDLAGHNDPYEYYKKRLSEIKVQKRDDVKTMCSWCATLPKSMDIKDSDKFFKSVYDFMCKRYGKENIVSAVVHMDETTPHIHIKFIPAIRDKKHPERYKCSAKEVINRKELQTIHVDLSKEMERIFGYDIGVLNGATAGGNKTLQELKNQSLIEQNEKLQLEVFDSQRVIKQGEQMREQLQSLSGQVKSAEEIKSKMVKPKLFKRDIVELPYKTYMDLVATATEKKEAQDMLQEAKQLNIQTKQKEAEIDRKTHILDERERSFKASVDDVINQRVERSLDTILKEQSVSDKLTLAKAFINQANLTNEFMQYVKIQTRAYTKYKVKEAVKDNYGLDR